MTINFDLPEESAMMRDAVREFAEKEIRPIAPELDEKEEFSPVLTKKMGDLGLLGVYIPEEYGGSGLNHLAYIVAVEEIARVDGSQAATVAAHNSLGLGPLYYFGTEEQKEKYLPKLTTGEKLWGFGLTEPDAGSDAGGTKTKAVQDGDEWVINGSKIFITNGSTPFSLGSTVQTVTGTRPDGKKRNLLVTAAPRFGEHGEYKGAFGIFRDITERKQAEEERERLIQELEDALTKVKTLSGLIPICSSCKKIRDDKGYWNQIEAYIKEHSDADFSHGFCPECMKKLYPEFTKKEDS